MNNGWLKLHRQAKYSKYFSMGLKHIGMFKVILLKANWKNGFFQGVEIKPGSFATSISGLAEDLGEDRRTVRKILDDLESFGMIKRINSANRWTHITICNWDTYQHKDDDDLPTGDQPDDQPSPDQVTIIEELKKLRTKERSDSFEKFWEAYDYKKSKGQAEKSWRKIPYMLYGKIIEAARKARAANPNKEYMQHPSTWLNAKGWEDDISTKRDKTTFSGGNKVESTDISKFRGE